jgi:hypothetical protein
MSPDREDLNELERLTRLVGGKKRRFQVAELSPLEAKALLGYLDYLRATRKVSAGVTDVVPEEITYDTNQLRAALLKLIGIAASSSKKP